VSPGRGIIIPIWKKYISYVVEIPLENLTGSDHEHLNVSLRRGRIQLSTLKSIYSFDDLYLNFLHAFKRISLPSNGAEILILGLGLASIPYLLEKTFHKKYKYKIVEIDEAIIYLASKYTLPRLNSSLEIVHADASHYLELDMAKYDLVVMDIFIEDEIPSVFESETFLKQLKEKLKPQGQLLYNRLFRNSRDKVKTKQFFYGPFKNTFERSDFKDILGNWIIIGKP
jgi:hypothetical protein